CLESGPVRFGGRPRGKGPAHLAPRRAADPTQSSKGLAGLDEHQVRRWDSWHRWVTLALLAHAFLAITAARERQGHTPADDGTSPDGLIPLTCNEIQRLFITLVVQPVHDTAHRLGWSTWRRRHQARARHSHYQRQAALQP
ncbi:hypothetical protein ACFYXB_45875, partial [Streptomyces sp. NPDC002619]